jgi:hypothetical protein
MLNFLQDLAVGDPFGLYCPAPTGARHPLLVAYDPAYRVAKRYAWLLDKVMQQFWFRVVQDAFEIDAKSRLMFCNNYRPFPTNCSGSQYSDSPPWAKKGRKVKKMKVRGPNDDNAIAPSSK